VKGCGVEVWGEDEDDLVTQMQAHIAAVHANYGARLG
jgi:Protein of unknown function (DUF1059)